ncbi:MAG TPA: polysaccharide deacetylase family protein [Stellaceae bacterium]|jgi:hypothetical protein|nr:polysaccharide deacetylase family protein [Stellaceae bacterium]
MSYLPRADAATTADWAALIDEFDRWQTAGRVATLWWRDDDAVTPTAQLKTLLQLAGGVPLGLAVIPALAHPELADALREAPEIAVLPHGWRHANHAVRGKKSEYSQGRPAAAVTAELSDGLERLCALFGARSLPMLVPPWNRIAPEFLPLLSSVGLQGLSTMASNHPPALPPGLAAADVHVDLVAWHGDRGFVGTAAALDSLLEWLQTARQSDHAAPIGILTHHLIIDSPTVSFLERLIAIVTAHAGVRWAAPTELLP